jgi:hypothetical protein
MNLQPFNGQWLRQNSWRNPGLPTRKTGIPQGFPQEYVGQGKELVLPHNDWPALYDGTTPQASSGVDQRLREILFSMCNQAHFQLDASLIMGLIESIKGIQQKFRFLKQHYVSHVVSDIRQKGTTDNLSTRPGEGFQQEAAEAYEQTNRKRAETQVCDVSTQLDTYLHGLQMVRIDENQEVIANIHMAIDDFNSLKAETQVGGGDGITNSPNLESQNPQQHWIFGSPNGTQLNSRDLERMCAPTNRDFLSGFTPSSHMLFPKKLLGMKI